MVELFVFYIHIVGAVAMFTKRWQEEGLSEGLLAVLFVALIFFVGWSITTFLTKLMMDREGLGIFIGRDAASLLLLTVGETILYYFYLRDEKRSRSSDDVTPTIESQTKQ